MTVKESLPQRMKTIFEFAELSYVALWVNYVVGSVVCLLLYQLCKKELPRPFPAVLRQPPPGIAIGCVFFIALVLWGCHLVFMHIRMAIGEVKVLHRPIKNKSTWYIRYYKRQFFFVNSVFVSFFIWMIYLRFF